MALSTGGEDKTKVIRRINVITIIFIQSFSSDTDSNSDNNTFRHLLSDWSWQAHQIWCTTFSLQEKKGITITAAHEERQTQPNIYIKAIRHTNIKEQMTPYRISIKRYQTTWNIYFKPRVLFHYKQTFMYQQTKDYALLRIKELWSVILTKQNNTTV